MLRADLISNFDNRNIDIDRLRQTVPENHLPKSGDRKNLHIQLKNEVARQQAPVELEQILSDSPAQVLCQGWNGRY